MENLYDTFFKIYGDLTMTVIVLKILAFIVPIVIAINVSKMRQENKELKNELAEIKNLLILQNELLRNQQSNHNQYFQQQPNNNNNGSFSQY